MEGGHIHCCEDTNWESLVDDVCRQQHARGDLVADVLIAPGSVVDSEVVETNIQLDQVVTQFVENRESLPRLCDVVSHEDTRLRAGVVRPVDGAAVALRQRRAAHHFHVEKHLNGGRRVVGKLREELGIDLF